VKHEKPERAMESRVEMPIEFQPETGKKKETQALYTIFYFLLAKIQLVQGTIHLHGLHNSHGVVVIILIKYIKIIFF